jgi:hypothetical protein
MAEPAIYTENLARRFGADDGGTVSGFFVRPAQ